MVTYFKSILLCVFIYHFQAGGCLKKWRVCVLWQPSKFTEVSRWVGLYISPKENTEINKQRTYKERATNGWGKTERDNSKIFSETTGLISNHVHLNISGCTVCVCVCPDVSMCPSYVPGAEYVRHERAESSNNITAVFLKKKGKRKRVDRREGGCEMNEWQSGRWDAREKKMHFQTHNGADISCQLNSRVLSFRITWKWFWEINFSSICGESNMTWSSLQISQ